MERISIALARLERVKELLKIWQQKKPISNIERNIVLNQLAALYDELLDLDISEEKVPEIIPNKPEEQSTTLDVKEIAVVERENEPVIAVQPLVISETPIVEEQESQPKVVVKQQEQKVQKEQDKTVRLGDKFAGIYKYLYDNFENQDESSFARYSAIDDINRAIGINDRFLFIKELFDGDKDLFGKTISTLNSCSSLDDALMYIHENFRWNSEEPAVKQLVLLLYRRFK